MKAGRELDVIVAEEVMALRSCNEWTHINLGSGGGPRLLHGSLEKPGSDHDCYPALEYGPLGGPRHYSTDISAAWEVIEKVQARALGWTLVCPTNYRWVAYQRTGCADPDFGDWWEFGDTAPHAICLAALKALGIEP